MAQRVPLTAEPREVFGKKVKRLRDQGILPANIYGRGIESKAIQLDVIEFLRVVRREGVRSMFELTVEGESEPRYVLIRALERFGGTGHALHADFYQVALNQEITTYVPLHFVGEAPAVEDLGGTLLSNLDTIQIRCLPLNIPDAIEADISSIATFDDVIHIGDLEVPEGVQIIDDPEVMVATVSRPRILAEEEEEAEAEAELEEAEEGAETAEEGEEVAEGAAEAAEGSEE